MRVMKNIVLVFMTISLMSCNPKQKQEVSITKETQEKVVELISADDLQKIDKSAQLIDVRTPEEFNEGYIKNAKNSNFYDDDFLNQMSSLDKNKPVYVYCKSGGRSGSASKKLKEAGFTKVYDLEGGFMKWESEGKMITEIK